jgi:hypothetical protein
MALKRLMLNRIDRLYCRSWAFSVQKIIDICAKFEYTGRRKSSFVINGTGWYCS